MTATPAGEGRQAPLRVVVLAGGRSSEHQVSLASGRAVQSGLRGADHDVVTVEIGRDGRWRHDGSEIAVVPGRGLLDADVAFPVLHGPFGEDGTVQGLLECLDVAYVGAGVLAAAVCMDKVLFKELMGAAGIPQVRYAGLRERRWRGEREVVLGELAALGLPVFVKPARLGSSLGIVRVAEAQQLAGAIDRAFEHDPLAIVEALGAGLEVECSVLGRGEDADGVGAAAATASEPGEIVLRGSDWYDYDAKYTPGGMELVVPARISPGARARVRALALEVFERVGCHGLARVDFFVDGDTVLVNELNTMPGFTPTSVYAKLFEASGVAYPELVDRLCRLALERHRRERGYRF